MVLVAALRGGTSSCEIVRELSICEVAGWVPGALPRYDFYSVFLDVVNT